MAKRPGDGSAGGSTAALGRPYLVPLSGPRSLRVIKRQIYQGLSQTLAEASQWADLEILESLACEDFKDGVAHFREKRVPVFNWALESGPMFALFTSLAAPTMLILKP